MKHIHYILLALLCATFNACMDDDWKDPKTEIDEAFGNSNIKETNVITIKQLKQRYLTEINTLGAYAKVGESLQIKGYVTGNDVEGNMYNEISIQDATGGIFIGVAQGGVFSYLPIGTEIIVELKGLYVGNYRRSATIGTLYTDKNGDVSVSRMARAQWQQHFKITGNTHVVEPEVFADGNATSTWDITMDAGKLGVLKNVTFKSGGYWNANLGPEGTYVEIPNLPADATFAVPGFSTSWYFNEQPDETYNGKTAVQIYNSNYADFAALPLPRGKVNVTGVLKHYCNKKGERDQWEIIIRSYSDVVPAE